MNGKTLYHVVEHFVSINGEGRRAGQPALFIRFAGCNLNCEYCDTRWANESDVEYEEYTACGIARLIRNTGIKNVTVTGGEPLIQPGIDELMDEFTKLSENRIEIETNGSVDISHFLRKNNMSGNITFTLDYKTGISGMESHMCMSNYEFVRACDTVKFVVGNRKDMDKAGEVIKRYRLTEKGCGVYISPCFGSIQPAEIVDYVCKNRWNDVNVQLQLHKYIWSPEKRGV